MTTIRGLALVVVVGLMAAAGSGAFTTPADTVLAAPSEQRFGPESFFGTIVPGSLTSTTGITRFVVERPKKVGLDIDPTTRETVICQLENVTANQAALVTANQGSVPQAVSSPTTAVQSGTPGQVLYFYGSYDPALNVFFVSNVSADAASIAALTAPVGSTGDDDDDDDDDDNSSDDDDDGGDDDDDDDDDD